MNYTYNGVVEQNGRLVFDDFDDFKTVLDSLEKNDSTYTANHPEPDLVDANGNNITGISPILDDFEDAFPNFTSYHRKIETDEINALNAGNSYYNEHIIDDYPLATLFNEDLEIQIGTSIYKKLNQCERIVIYNEDEAALTRFNSGLANPMFEPNIVPHSDCYKINQFQNERCIPYFSFYNNSINGLSIDFYNGSVFESNNNVKFTWNFGDGQTYEGWNASHTYSQPGTYNVCLFMEGDCMESYCQNVTVGSTNDCAANWTFSFSNSSFTSVSFFNSSSPSFGSSGLYYSWDFGDNSGTSTQENPSHSFTGSGTHNVCLTITDMTTGCTDTDCQSIVIGSTVGTCNCKAIYSDDDEFLHPNDSDKKMKIEASLLSSMWIYTYKVVARTKSREKGFGGKWWRERADRIEVGISGKVFRPNSGLWGNCDTEINFADGIWPRNNRSQIKAAFRPGHRMRVKEADHIIGVHEMTEDNFVFPTGFTRMQENCN